jgi:hypothetical protein
LKKPIITVVATALLCVAWFLLDMRGVLQHFH